MFTRENLVELHEALCSDARAILEAKNHDYCGNSVFANLTLCEKLGICSTEKGVLIRVMDKIKRLLNYLESGEFKVNDEGVNDMIVDTINYLVLVYAIMQVRAGTLPPDGDLVLPEQPNKN